MSDGIMIGYKNKNGQLVKVMTPIDKKIKLSSPGIKKAKKRIDYLEAREAMSERKIELLEKEVDALKKELKEEKQADWGYMQAPACFTMTIKQLQSKLIDPFSLKIGQKVKFSSITYKFIGNFEDLYTFEYYTAKL